MRILQPELGEREVLVGYKGDGRLVDLSGAFVVLRFDLFEEGVVEP